MLPVALHTRVRQEQEKAGMTLGEYVEALITEYYDWKDGRIMTGEMRTLAAQIPAELFDRLDRYLKERGIKARAIQRRNSYLIYLKSGTAISSFLALVGAHQSALKMENERVVKSVRNDVNRRVNAEIANQAKASAASVEQIMTIRYVLEHRDLATLPQALQEYIKLRIAYPDATLKELGEAADPPLSKSAINHRVRRVEQLAQEIARKEQRG